MGDSTGGSAGEPPRCPESPESKLLKQIKIDSAWVLAPALFDSKGRIRRDHVMIEGRDEAHAEGSYFLEFWDQGKRKREAVGPVAFVAADRAKHRQAELSAIRRGLIEAPVIVEAPERTKISDALEKYTDYIQYHRSLRTFRTYRPILKSFGELQPHLRRRDRSHRHHGIREALSEAGAERQDDLQQAGRHLPAAKAAWPDEYPQRERLAELRSDRASDL